MAPSYEVIVADNYDYMDESAYSSGGRFDTYESAVRAAKRIVDTWLRDAHEPGMSAGELLGKYKMFGEDPFIRLPEGVDPPDKPFSAWRYAETRCRQLCG